MIIIIKKRKKKILIPLNIHKKPNPVPIWKTLQKIIKLLSLVSAFQNNYVFTQRINYSLYKRNKIKNQDIAVSGTKITVIPKIIRNLKIKTY